MGYSSRNKAYRVYNKRTKTIVETINVKFDEGDDGQSGETMKEDDEHETKIEKETNKDDVTTEQLKRNLEVEKLKFKADHPPKLVIGNPTAGIRTRSSFNWNLCDLYLYNGFISEIEPKDIETIQIKVGLWSCKKSRINLNEIGCGTLCLDLVIIP